MMIWWWWEENDAKVNIDGQAIEDVKKCILEASLHGIMTVPKTYKDYFSNVQRVTIYMEILWQWNNDWC